MLTRANLRVLSTVLKKLLLISSGQFLANDRDKIICTFFVFFSFLLAQIKFHVAWFLLLYRFHLIFYWLNEKIHLRGSFFERINITYVGSISTPSSSQYDYFHCSAFITTSSHFHPECAAPGIRHGRSPKFFSVTSLRLLTCSRFGLVHIEYSDGLTSILYRIIATSGIDNMLILSQFGLQGTYCTYTSCLMLRIVSRDNIFYN